MQFDIPSTDTLETSSGEPRQQSPTHRSALEKLHEAADGWEVTDLSIAGDAATERTTTIGLAVAKIVITRRQRSYRARDTLLAPSDALPGENVRWVSIRGNSSLPSLMSKYGADLLAYDSDQTQAKVELLSVELFETHSRNVRILVRRRDQE